VAAEVPRMATQSQTETVAKRSFSEDLQAQAKALGETVIVLIGLAYLCGFIVLYTFENKLGIHDTNAEVIRIRYIHTGLLCLAFPIFLLIPMAAHIWMYFRQRPNLDVYDKLKAAGYVVGRSRLTYTVQLFCTCFCLFVFLLFEPYGQLHARLKWIAFLLILSVAPVVFLRRYLGFSANKERPWLRVSATALSVTLLYFALWGTIDLASILVKGASYWLFTIALALYSMGSASQRPFYWLVGQREGVQIARWAVVATLSLMSILSFAYRVFPFIPADKGGGNFRFSRDAQICLLADERIAPEISIRRGDLACTVPVKILDITDLTFYVARTDDKGRNEKGEIPVSDQRGAPEIWSDGEYFPTVYAIPRSKSSFIQYDFKMDQNAVKAPEPPAGTVCAASAPALPATPQLDSGHPIKPKAAVAPPALDAVKK